MRKIIFVLIIACLLSACHSNETTAIDSELIGVWLAPAPLSEGIFYRPNLITDITPDRMRIYEDVENPTDFTWKKEGSTIIYKNETQENKLQIIDNQNDRLVVTLENGDTLRFFRLSANKNTATTDADILSKLYTETFEIIIAKLNWQIRKLLFLPGGILVKYEMSKSNDVPTFSTGNWQLLVIRNHYFLLLNNLPEEKPLLVYLENFSEFKINGQMAYANKLHPVAINVVGTETDLSTLQKVIIGKWQASNYEFNKDSTFVEIAKNDTLTGYWQLNTTGEVIVLKKENNETLQFGYVNPKNKTIRMHYFKDFYNELTMETIGKD